MTEFYVILFFMKEKGRNKEEKRISDLILGSGRNEEEVVHGRRIGIIDGDLEEYK